MSSSLLLRNPVDPVKAMRFFTVVGNLKRIKRTGWVNNSIEAPESVSDHMYRMTMLGMLVTDSSLDRQRLLRMCLVHDLAEAVVGDITPFDGVSKEEKRRREETALKDILGDLGDPDIAGEILGLWLEYEECLSGEARVAHELDKLEMIIQASEYKKASLDSKRLDSFFESTKDSFSHPEVLSWAEQVRIERNARNGTEIRTIAKEL